MTTAAESCDADQMDLDLDLRILGVHRTVQEIGVGAPMDSSSSSGLDNARALCGVRPMIEFSSPLPPAPCPLRWYALQVHTGFESKVGARLALDGIDSYWAARQVKLRGHNQQRDKVVSRSLFPGYLFVQLAGGRLSTECGHIIRVLGFGERHPIAIPDQEIESIRALANAPDVQTAKMYTAGQKIYVARGPLAGAYGVVQCQKKNKPVIVVNVMLLGRAVSAKVDPDCLQEINNQVLPLAA